MTITAVCRIFLVAPPFRLPSLHFSQQREQRTIFFVETQRSTW